MKLRWKIAIGIVLLIGGSWLAVVWMRHRAQTALANYRHELLARGEKLLTAELIPAPTTNLPNGALPVMNARNRLGTFDYAVQPPAMKSLSPGRALVAWKQSQLPTSTSTNVWPGLRAMLSSNHTAISELCLALEECNRIQFDVLYRFDAQSAHMIPLKSAAQWLLAASLLELHDQRPSEAWPIVRGLTLLATKYDAEPILISHLIQAAIVHTAFAATWEALQYDGWTDDQLAELQDLWAARHYLPSVERVIAMERALGGDAFRQYRQNPGLLTRTQAGMSSGSVLSEMREMAEELAQGSTEGLKAVGATIVWSAWISYEDELCQLRSFQFELEGVRQALRTENMRSYFENTNRARGEIPRGYLISQLLFSGELVPKLVRRIVNAETASRMAATAIALRRHQLRLGRLPPHLPALAPDFMAAVPRDPMDGQLLRYKLQDAGHFLLYSVGPDGKDDGGDPRPRDEKSRRFPWQEGRDWVWPQAASPQEIEAYRARIESERPQSRRRP